MKAKPIGILTWHYYHNFGSALQAYALERSVEKLGFSARIINYRNAKFGPYSGVKTAVKSILHRLTGGRIAGLCYPFPCFQKTYFHETRCVREAEELRELCAGFGTVICGSDQIWAPNVLNPVYLLRDVPEGVNRVSYAASIGLNAIPDALQPIYRENLLKFKAVSVREEKGAELIKSIAGITPKVVPDPTLLLTQKEWQWLEHPVRGIGGKKYVFCYFLKKDHRYRERVTEYAAENGLQLIGCSENPQDRAWLSVPEGIGPCEFLWLISNAEAVITDSYHGTIFSLLYGKRFVTIERFTADEGICQNSRLERLKTCFGLKDCIVPQSLPGKLCPIAPDRAAFEQKAEALRTDAVAFLGEALR